MYHTQKISSTYLVYKADLYYNIPMKESKSKPNVSIRINPEVLYQAKIEAVKAKVTLGEWLERAIREKIAKEG